MKCMYCIQKCPTRAQDMFTFCSCGTGPGPFPGRGKWLYRTSENSFIHCNTNLSFLSSVLSVLSWDHGNSSFHGFWTWREATLALLIRWPENSISMRQSKRQDHVLPARDRGRAIRIKGSVQQSAMYLCLTQSFNIHEIKRDGPERNKINPQL